MKLNGVHVPVLVSGFLEHLAETERLYREKGREYFIDMTFGNGGHTLAMLNKFEWLKIIGMDRDPEACRAAETIHAGHIASGRLSIINGNFADFDRLIPASVLEKTVGALADFGISSIQLDKTGRGFSFDDSASIDMRMDREGHGETAGDVLNNYGEREIANILYYLGEEKFSREIARSVIKFRQESKFTACHEFAELVRNVYKRHPGVRMEIDFATKAVMALRVHVNGEFDNIKRLLEKTPEKLPAGSLVFLISFHSLEDRIVKNFITEESKNCVCPVNFPVCRCDHRARVKPMVKKPIMASEAEMKENPRSRSAKMRIYEIL